MSKHHSYFRNGREIAESEAIDRDGCLRDGCSVIVRMQMRDTRMTDLQRTVAADAVNRRPVYDAFGRPAGHRPGAAFTDDRAAREAKARAYQLYDEEIGRAWQQTNPRGRSEAATGAGEHGQGGGDWQACPDCNGHDATCSTCNGRGFIGRDDAALEAVFQQTQTHHEGGRGLDAVMRDHQANMAAVYAAYDSDLTEAWRK
jgi:hypothetical protein